MIDVKAEYARISSAQAARQQESEKPVYTTDDIVRAITLAAQQGTGLSVRLASDVTVGKTIFVPATVPRFQLTGGGIFKLVYTAPLTAVLSVDQPALLTELEAEGSATNTADCFVTTSNAIHTDLLIRECRFSDTTSVLDPTKTWQQGPVRTGPGQFMVTGSGTTSGAVSLTITEFTPPPSKSLMLTARILAHRTNGSDPGQTASWHITQNFKTSAAGVVTISSVLQVLSGSDEPGLVTAIDTASGFIRIRAAGVAAQDWKWSTTTTVDEL